MDKKLLEHYLVEDFMADESFINYYFNADKGDREFWEGWLLQHPEKMAAATEATGLIGMLSLSLPEEEYRKELSAMMEAIEKPRFSGRFHLRQIPALRRHGKRWIQYPVFILLVAAGLWWLLRHTESTNEKWMAQVNNSSAPEQLILSDSTVVVLQPHSTIRYPKEFTEKIRNVYLAGNAGFTVKRNVHHPFKVHTENMIATVLGTVFNVKKSGDSIVVELLKGKLNVEIVSPAMETQQSVLLAPNERAVYVRNNQHLYKNLIIPGYLDFRHSNFNEIASKIQSVYGITLINNSSKKDWRFTGEFKNNTVKDIIENICLVKNLTYSMQGDTIVIR